MPLANLLTAERIVLLTTAGRRDQVLDAAARMLADGLPTQTATLGAALHAREQLGSTAIGHGVAIPHARSNVFNQARGAFLRLDHPVDFGNGEQVPVDLVFATSVPEHSPQLQLDILAEIAAAFGDPEWRDALRGARDLTTLRGLLLGLPQARMAMNG